MALVKGNKIKLDAVELPLDEAFNPDDVINNGGDPFVFDEEFDKEDVVNGKKNENSKNENSEDVFFTKEELESMADSHSDSPMAAHLSGILGFDEPKESSVVKREDIKTGKVKIQDFNNSQNDEEFIFPKDDDEQEFYFDDSDLDDEDDDFNKNEPNSSKSAEIMVPEEPKPVQTEEFKRPEEELQEFLQQNFKDFIKAPVISNNLKRAIEHSRIPGENVKHVKKTIEISDKLDRETSISHTSHVVLNRSEDGELESIEVVCKCGERTLIKFDYFDEFTDDDKLTEFVDDIKETVPFSELSFESEEINIVDPELVIKSARFYDDDEEDENEIYEEEEDDEDDDEFNWDFDDDED